MNTIMDIEEAVKRLGPADLAAFRDWFARFDAHAWDQQLAEDVASGRLDRVAKEALKDLDQGRCRDL